MYRNQLSRLLASSLIASTLMTIGPIALGATAQDIEHLRNSSMEQRQREANQRAEEQARQVREQMRRTAEENRQRAKDLEDTMRRHEQERVEVDRKLRLEAREKEMAQEAAKRMPLKVPPAQACKDLPECASDASPH